MNKPKLKPYQVWKKRVGREVWSAVVIESLGGFMDSSGGATDAAKVMIQKRGFRTTWTKATWKNGPPKGWERIK